MDTLCVLILFLILCSIGNLVFAENSVWDEEPVWDTELTFPGCGRRSTSISTASGRGRRSPNNTAASDAIPLVLGARESEAYSWPWMVAIFKKNLKRVFCGASLISQKYVLTAAHCVASGGRTFNPQAIDLVFGAHTRKDGTMYPVKKILVHPDYKDGMQYNDIALIEVGRQVKLSQKTYPVCLPSSELRKAVSENNSMVTVKGWGDTYFKSERGSEELREVTIPIVPLKQCKRVYGRGELVPYGLTKEFFCTGFVEGGKDSCQGDSGGPVVYQLKNNHYVQLGIISFAKGCGLPGVPGVKIRVSEYAKWIYNNTDLGKIKSESLTLEP